MKKIFLTAAAIFAFGFANAQEAANGFSKGDKFVEGSFSFRSGDVEDSWSFNPSMGYVLDDQWAIGGRLNFSGSDNNVLEKNKYGVTAFGRYYFLSLGATKNFQAYGELGLGYSSVKSNGYYIEDTDIFVPYSSDQTNGEMNANIDLGMNYFFTSHWAATFKLANILSYNSTNPESGSNSSDLNVNVNLFNNIFAQPQFGLLYKW